MDVSNEQRSVGVIPPDLLLAAYASGYFPMADSREGRIAWYSPDPRTIIPLASLRISRSLHQTLRKKIFEVRWDTSFEAVMRACGAREETWISEEIVESYVKLADLGIGHSVETWRDNKLAGGLYGVALGGAFFGESMFSRERDASKVALVHLVERLRARKFELLDTQFMTPHLMQLGAIEIPRETYLEQLRHALRLRPSLAD
jgi:leucyl/phenylalanyl-tRNA---protein transferase